MIRKNVLVLFFISTLSTAVLAGCDIRPIDPTAMPQDVEETSTTAQISRIPEETIEYTSIENQVENSSIPIKDSDLIKITDFYRLPELERMAEEDSKKLVEPLQSIRRVKNSLRLDIDQIYYPEYNYKASYDRVSKTLSKNRYGEERLFEGNRASQLNEFLSNNKGATVKVAELSLDVDETIQVPANTYLDGNDCQLVFDGAKKAIEIKDVDGAKVSNFIIVDSNFEYGIFVDRANSFILEGNTIEETGFRALCILNRCHDFILFDNAIRYNAQGGIFICGNVYDGIIERNDISDNLGSANSFAGLFLGEFKLPEEGTAETLFWEPDQTELVDSPHQIVIIKNDIDGNLSQGIYSHAGWSNYIVDNSITYNHKEGTCLDYGTAATYVSNNQYIGNGERIGVEDGEPEFNKLPGISLDNACYNIIRGNIFSYNGGSGIKAVRSSCRNIIVDNSVENNNRGVSDNGHFFGVELAGDLKPDYEGAAGLDFAPCFENIVARNIISGPHYAGIYLGEGDYCNDAFNNVIMGASNFSIESHSEKFNSVVDNFIDMPEFYNGEIIPTPAEE